MGDVVFGLSVIRSYLDCLRKSTSRCESLLIEVTSCISWRPLNYLIPF